MFSHSCWLPRYLCWGRRAVLKYNYSTHIFCKHPEASSDGWKPTFFNKRILSTKHISSTWKHSENAQAILTVKMNSFVNISPKQPLKLQSNFQVTLKGIMNATAAGSLESLPKLWDISTHLKQLCFSAIAEAKHFCSAWFCLLTETLLCKYISTESTAY